VLAGGCGLNANPNAHEEKVEGDSQASGAESWRAGGGGGVYGGILHGSV